jgi:hypothetical protein
LVLAANLGNGWAAATPAANSNRAQAGRREWNFISSGFRSLGNHVP